MAEITPTTGCIELHPFKVIFQHRQLAQFPCLPRVSAGN
jgi:hypothetical protein